MQPIRVIAAGTIAAIAAWAAGAITGDARRGEQLFQTQQCIACHSINGRGGSLAPDLAKRVDRDFTPTLMASLMWNHAPDMWSAMEKQGVTRPHLSPEQAADLFAYFVSARYFEKPGDAARGKADFTAWHCSTCHGITTSKAAGAPPVFKWESLADPIVLAQQMWNHGAKMRVAFANMKIPYPTLTAQELTDMLVYLQHLPETRNLATNFMFPPSDEGAALFQSKGCANCHKGAIALENLLRNQTITQIAVDMWNHEPNMKQQPPALSQEEMRQILGYLWAKEYFRGHGDAARGNRVFTDKHCATCHNNPASGAPNLAQHKPYSDITMVSALWDHGPHMLALMKQKSIPWPSFNGREMADLIAYLNSMP